MDMAETVGEYWDVLRRYLYVGRSRGGVRIPVAEGHQRAECTGGGVADEVEVADLLRDDAQAWAGVESLYLWAKDLAEDHIL